MTKDPFANLDDAFKQGLSGPAPTPPTLGNPSGLPARPPRPAGLSTSNPALGVRQVPIPGATPPAPRNNAGGLPTASPDPLSSFNWGPSTETPVDDTPTLTVEPAAVQETPEEPVNDGPAGPMLQNISSRAYRTQKRVASNDLHLDDLLRRLVEAGSSDLHLTANMEPMMRKHGEIQPLPGFPTLSSSQIEQILFQIMSPQQQTIFQQEHDLDMAHEIAGLSRFRVNVLQQRRMIGSVIRVIPNEIKTLEELGMPENLTQLALKPRGLVLVTGPTGSGKSTTLAAIVDQANKLRKDHIITIEDPIEFVHQNQNSIITQREVGVDTASFAEGLKRALREDPDIILVGEMRDRETIETAITAAETGHLVFGTLHTQSAAETMNRIIDSFPAESKDQVRAQLASTIQGIVSQTLMKKLGGGGRVAALEILLGDPALRNMIRMGKTEQIPSTLEINKAKGMQTLDMHLATLVVKNKVAIDDAMSKATSEDNLTVKLGGAQAVEKIRRSQHALSADNPYKR